MNDNERGLYGKYRVEKADGTPTDPLAEYLVLRIDQDAAARKAAVVYADAIELDNPKLAKDIREWAYHHAEVND